jgi:hypothetical protein
VFDLIELDKTEMMPKCLKQQTPMSLALLHVGHVLGNLHGLLAHPITALKLQGLHIILHLL